MSGVCSRCGRAGEMEYGADGLSYCSACIFYGLNRQCWRCMMYLPISELQQYRGQWACPYCIQDMRYEDRKKGEGPAPEKPHLDVLQYVEQCERCGRDLQGRVYIWNGKKLCKHCLGDEQQEWGLMGGGPMGPPQRITVEALRPARKKSLVERAVSEFLALTGLKKRSEIREIIVYSPKMQAEIGAAKPMSDISPLRPMAETPMAVARKKSALEEARKPQQEGIIRASQEKKAEAKTEAKAEAVFVKGGGRKKAKAGREKRQKKAEGRSGEAEDADGHEYAEGGQEKQ